MTEIDKEQLERTRLLKEYTQSSLLDNRRGKPFNHPDYIMKRNFTQFAAGKGETYNKDNRKIEFNIPKDDFVPNNSYFTMQLGVTAQGSTNFTGNVMPNNTYDYQRAYRFSSIWRPFQYIEISTKGSNILIQDPECWMYVKYSLAPKDYVDSTLKCTGLYSTPQEKNYNTGGALSNWDVHGMYGPLVDADTGLPAGNLQTDQVYTGYFPDAEGVNKTLGLNLDPVTAAAGNPGANVLVAGQEYIMWIPGLFETEKVLFCSEMPTITVKMVLNNDSAVVTEYFTGAGITSSNPSFAIKNFIYNMNTVEIQASAKERLMALQLAADQNLRMGLKYDFEHVENFSATMPVNSTDWTYVFDVNARRAKAIFLTFRDNQTINSYGYDNKGGNFICPARMTQPEDYLRLQWNIDGTKPFPEQALVIKPREKAYAYQLYVEAMQSLKDVFLGNEVTMQAYLQPKNFILGFKLNQDDDLISDVAFNQLTLKLTMSAAAGIQQLMPGNSDSGVSRQQTNVNAAGNLDAHPITVDLYIVSDRTLYASKSFAEIV